jgi:uncharacterized protein with PQ loop repeat
MSDQVIHICYLCLMIFLGYGSIICTPKKKHSARQKTPIQVVHLIHGIRRALEQILLWPKMEAPMKHKNVIALHGVLVILHLGTAQ